MTEAEMRALIALLPAGDPRLVQVRHRWVNRTEHWAWIFDERIVIKQYTQHPGKQNRWKVWEKERRALDRLHGLPAPACLGHLAVREPSDLPAHVLFKEYVRGVHLESLDADAIAEFANLMAAIHARGVVTNDPTRPNLIRTCDGRLVFIDFGRAAVYPLRGPVYWWYLGKELMRTYRKALGSRPEDFAVYWPRYRAALGNPGGWRLALLAAAFRYWCRRKNLAAPPISR